MRQASAEFVTPPRPARGGRPYASERDSALAAELRERPGAYKEYGRCGGDGEAEAVRRRVYRGAGAWCGGRAAWSVVVRKVGDGEWCVYVAFRDQAREEAAS